MPRKRANGEGSIYQDPSHPKSPWVAAWTHEGKTHRKRFATQSDARAHLTGVQAAIQRGEYAAPDRMAVGDWLTAYIRDVAPLTLKPSTLAEERRITEQHLIPALGKFRLQDPRLRDRIQGMIREKAETLKPSTVRRIKSVLHKALREAVRRRYIAYNPADELSMPKMEKSHVKALSLAEARQLLPHLPDTTEGRALRFILLTGLRVGEMCALRWRDVDETAIHIRHAISAGEISDTKTAAGRRTLALTDELSALLKTQHREQAVQRLKAGPSWQSGDFVFATAIGTPADRHNINRVLRAALKRAGLPPHSVHALRHSFASILLDSGTSIAAISAMLGHTNRAFTMNTYVHSDTATEQAGMEKMSSTLS